MSMNRLWVLPIALLVLLPGAAHSGVTLGANLGFTQLSSDGSSSFSLTVPSDLYFGIQPGLRLGFLDAQAMTEVYFDFGAVAIDDASLAALTVNFQRNLARAATTPYLTIGAGFHSYGFDGTIEANPIYGGGIGVMHRLGHGHGAVRAEFRYDALRDSESDNTLTSVGLKAGFDLEL